MSIATGPKTGLKTTEFYVCVGASAVGGLCLLFGSVMDSPDLIAAGKQIISFAAVGYGAARGLAKLPER